MRILLALLLTAFSGARLVGQTVVAGQQLEIGPVGSDQVYNSTSDISGAIGSGNFASGHSLAVGLGNDAISSSLACGWWNYAYGASASFGYGNHSDGDACVLMGSSNRAETSYDEGSAYSVLIVGQYNAAYYEVNSSLVAGYNNIVSKGMGSATVGVGLSNHWNHATIVGCYNDATAGDDVLLFAVGNGSTSNRSNALEVHRDGKILMPRQGDILMGEFGNPE